MKFYLNQILVLSLLLTTLSSNALADTNEKHATYNDDVLTVLKSIESKLIDLDANVSILNKNLVNAENQKLVLDKEQVEQLKALLNSVGYRNDHQGNALGLLQSIERQTDNISENLR
jgi:hypothetical protein